jgi:hypothetical protein
MRPIENERKCVAKTFAAIPARGGIGVKHRAVKDDSCLWSAVLQSADLLTASGFLSTEA